MAARWLLPLSIALVIGLSGCAATATPTPVSAGVQAQAKRSGAVTGDVRKHADFASKHLDRKRDVWVYVPPGYEAQGKTRYPVLYMHDGNNLFDAGQAFGGHEWQVDETAERMIRSGELPPMIIVGVANTSARMDEYNWVQGAYQGKPYGGEGPAYGRFLVSELKPFIDRTYRTKTGRADTGVMGSSLGGLISLYLGRHHGDTFGKIGVMSPSIFWADKAVLAEAPRLPKSLKIWLDMGGREGNGAEESLEDARELNRRLQAAGFEPGRNLKYHEDAVGGHDERAWAYRLPMALKFLFD